MVVIGVRIHALLADEAKVNFVSGAQGRNCAAGAQPKNGAGQQVDDLLVRVPRPVSPAGREEGFVFEHGRRFDGKRRSC
ncbi:hypothetical protein [Sulfuritortus calidifontis]|uniref:hypothetical protein n=1 Tax=Sulfuritortus calidifontis TaxID=1914471 RepID=UPI0014044DE5|nr:hypothetical protein [Sulfuritortus calidifontis]